MRIFITGFMGAGKTYLGRTLAEQLGFQFIDLDELIEAKLGMAISLIFQDSGETAFREIEAECLRSLAGQHQIVVSTGGGCPCFLENMEWMNGHGITLYFYATPGLLTKRLSSEKEHRPLISDIPPHDLEQFIEAKLGERALFYEQSHLKFLVPELGTDGLEKLAEYLRRFFT